MSAPSFTYSGNVYTAGVAGTVDFPLTSTTGNAIPYLEPSHIHVYESADSGVTWTELTRPAQWDFVSSGTVARLAAGISSGEWVKVQRITPSSSSYVTFQASSLLTAEQLNSDTLFNTYLNQEGADQGAQSSADATAATAAANAATAAASSATSAAASATSTANAASAAAAGAVTTADAASAAAAGAVTTANAASSTAAGAVTTANAAAADAATAVSTASDAETKADQAIASVSAAVLFSLVPNVASIPASPVNDDYIEVGNSTGIESFAPLAGVPSGFVGDSGLTVRLRYTSAGATWNWLSYFPNNSEDRYVKLLGLATQAQAEAGIDNTTWTSPLRVKQAIAALSPGGDGGGVVAENSQVIIADYTLAAGRNASSVGPVSIDAGVTFTISANSTWVIF